MSNLKNSILDDKNNISTPIGSSTPVFSDKVLSPPRVMNQKSETEEVIYGSESNRVHVANNASNSKFWSFQSAELIQQMMKRAPSNDFSG